MEKMDVLPNMLQEQEIRAENLIWAINEDYDLPIDLELLAKTGIEELDWYRVILFGAVYRLNEGVQLLTYFRKKREATKRAAIFSELMMLTLEQLLLPELKIRFAGLNDVEKEVIARVNDCYDKMSKRKDVFHEIRYAYYAYKKNIVPKTNPRVVDLLEDVLEFGTICAAQYTERLDRLLELHFHFEKIEETEQKGEEENRSRPERERLTHRINLPKRTEGIEPLEIMSAEFSQVDIGKNLEQMKKDLADSPMDQAESTEDVIRKRILESYGKPSIFGLRLEKLEQELATGIHQDEKLHITDRFLDIGGYRKQALLEQARENEAHFDYLGRVYRRNITKLKEELNRSITADLDYSATRLDHGVIMPSLVWRKTVLGDNKVFHKNYRDTRGELIVDLLLDASGSQIERQSRVAAEAFVIAEALSQVGILCRVSSFHNLFDYTVLKIYRDYRDPASKNRRIFSYKAEGSNRDGMALATMGKLLLEQSEEHKILIVLSDGKPNDERVGGAFNMVSSKTKPYVGEAAIYDTAHQVRLLRARGVAVLGVFTGDDEELEAERKIFGKDFAYISRIERFSDIVGKYLKKQILDILENG